MLGRRRLAHLFLLSCRPGPNGSFIAIKNGPLWPSGYLFQTLGLCSAHHCPPTTRQEGTPDIVFKLNGLFYVTFHGYDGTRGYRGIAATSDFNMDWRVDSSIGLFRDIMLGPTDCQSWLPQSIGVATTSHVVEGDYIYMLAEAADKNLACTPGGTWAAGLLRSYRAFVPTGQWQQYSGNPIVTTGPDPVPCKMNYQKMFRDSQDGSIYLTFWWFNSSGTYELRYYRLEEGTTPAIGALSPPLR
jgi:hypothetical protein